MTCIRGQPASSTSKFTAANKQTAKLAMLTA